MSPGAPWRSCETTRGSPARRLAALMLSAFFVLGFTTVFVALGASASAVGGFLLQHKTIFEYVAGGVIIVFGIYLTGLIRVPFFEREMRFAGRFAGGRPASAYLLGTAFAFGWTPCIGPVLGGILTLTATSARCRPRRRAAGGLFAGARCSVPDRGRVHRRLPAPHEAHPEGQQTTSDRRRRHPGGDGGRAHHWVSQFRRVLAARGLPPVSPPSARTRRLLRRAGRRVPLDSWGSAARRRARS